MKKRTGGKGPRNRFMRFAPMIFVGLLCHNLYFFILECRGQGHPNREPHGGNLALEYAAWNSKNAYVTTLLDEAMCESTQVLLFSLRNTNTSVLPIVLVPRQRLSSECNEAIQNLGAEVREVEEISVIKTASATEFNKHLRFTKLLAWNLTEFDRIILVDSDMVVLRNIDHLFTHAPLSAVEDPGAPGMFNSGLMVIRPDAQIFAIMLRELHSAPSYNSGDQGFLNYFFRDEWISNPELRLPITYNIFPRMKHYASWGLYRYEMYVLHFTAEVKPWTFFKQYHPNWSREFDSELSWIWWEHKIKKDALLQMGHTDHVRETSEDLSTKLETCRQWGRLQSRKLRNDMFTLMINTFDDVKSVKLLIDHYFPTPSLAEIHIIWHNPDVKPPSDLATRLPHAQGPERQAPPIFVHQQKSNTLNNRWGRPAHDFKTQIVLTIDDDTLVEDLEDVEFAFHVAQHHPWRLVGMHPRTHFRHTNGSLEYLVASEKDKHGFRQYSMVLTKFMFIDVQYFFMYTCLLPIETKAYVSRNLNCEDLAMNWMVSALTGNAPLAVMPHGRLLDMGTLHGDNLQRISLRSGHLQTRSECLQVFEDIMGPCPLTYADYVLNRFVKVPFVKVSLEDCLNNKNN